MDDTIEPAVDEVAKRRAKKLTKQIQAAADGLWALLLEAHEMQAWALMGYETWDAYVRAEFGMTRGNANRLVAQGEVIAAIEAASPGPPVTRARATPPIVSARQATQIKKDPAALPAITKAIAGGAAPADAVKAAAPVETHSRSRHVAEHHAPEQMRLWPDDPQKAMFASFDVVLDELGPEKTEKLVRTLLKRIEHAAPKVPTLADAPSQATCEHPKAREDKKPYGVWCGVCRKKIR